MQMSWQGMMQLMQPIASNEIKSKTTLPATTVIARSTVLGTSEKCVNEEGSDVVSPMEQVDSIIYLSGVTTC